MPDNASDVIVELAPPYRIGDRPARYQSLWLLARLYHAHHHGTGTLSIGAVRAQFPGKANLRMIISRAFSDFAGWGISVGWGARRDVAPALLRLGGRSQGPFWLDTADAARLRFTMEGQAADRSTLERFLGMDARPLNHDNALDYALRDVTYWNHLTAAMRMAQDGFSGQTSANVAESFRAARDCATDEFQAELALLKEGLAWRRYGQTEHSRRALQQLDTLLCQGNTNATPTFSAMMFIARGWDAYERNDLNSVSYELDRLAAHPDWSPVIRYNPRVRFEYLNLRALAHKSVALRDKASSLENRAHAAMAALTALSEALQAAYEADSIDAAQHVAANVGLTLWLFLKSGLIAPEQAGSERDVQMRALRWLGLSEWICDRFGVGGGSVWNTVFLLRIVRGRCVSGNGIDIKRFQAQSPLTVAELVDAVRPFHAPFSRAKGFIDWSGVATFALEEHDAGRVHYGPLQLANLLFESAWFHAHEHGLTGAAYAAVERLVKLLEVLRPAERGFFLEHLRILPLELQPDMTRAP